MTVIVKLFKFVIALWFGFGFGFALPPGTKVMPAKEEVSLVFPPWNIWICGDDWFIPQVGG